MTQPTNPARPSPLDKPDRFVARIRQLVADPGTRAALRSGLGRPPERAVRMHAVVAPWIPAGTSDATERAYYTVAALLAAAPRARADQLSVAPDSPSEAAPAGGRRTNLGAALAHAAATDALKPERAEAYLNLLVRQTTDGLHRHLPRVVRRLQNDHVPIDWAQLLDDLSRWGRWRDQVAKRWLQTFHRHRAPNPDDQPPAARTESEDQ